MHLPCLRGICSSFIVAPRRLGSQSCSRSTLDRIARHENKGRARRTISTPMAGASEDITNRDSYKLEEGGAPVDWQEYNGRWQKIWEGGLEPGQLFDAGKASGVLTAWLSSSEGRAAAGGKRALIPGCGRGYDVAAFAAAGADTALGLELSSKAVLDALHWLRDASGLPQELLERARVEEGDFFRYAGSGEHAGAWDCGFDYTFLCALHPEMRPDWARAWAALIKPGGVLVAIVFPVGKDPDQGPPWGVTPQLYEGLLSQDFTCEYLSECDHSQSHPSRAGKEWLGVWRRKAAS